MRRMNLTPTSKNSRNSCKNYTFCLWYNIVDTTAHQVVRTASLCYVSPNIFRLYSGKPQCCGGGGCPIFGSSSVKSRLFRQSIKIKIVGKFVNRINRDINQSPLRTPPPKKKTAKKNGVDTCVWWQKKRKKMGPPNSFCP